MKTITQNLSVLDYIFIVGLLVITGAATVVNIAFFSPIIPGLSHKLYIIPGIIAWIAAINLMVIGLAAEARKNHQQLSPVIVSQESTVRKIQDSKYYLDPKIHTYTPDETGVRYHTNGNTFVDKSKNQ